MSNTENSADVESLVKSKQRVSDHGEVFTPAWMVQDMLDLVKSESERIDSRFLEPACGSGNFLIAVLARKLEAVNSKFKKSFFELQHHALLALMSIYGIELLEDNVHECRANLLAQFTEFIGDDPDEKWKTAARTVLSVNIVHGDALKLETVDGHPLVFPEWGYLGKGRFQRRDFRFDALTQRASIEGTLFEALEEHEIFVPIQNYPSMTVREIAQ